LSGFLFRSFNFYNFRKSFVKVLIIKKKNTKKEIDTLLEKKEKSDSKEGNLSKHFGKLKRDIDGLEYQLEIRKNED
jgi:hypothetical protein